MPEFRTRPGERLRWHVIVQTQGRLDPSRDTPPLAWHLMERSDSTLPEGHCAWKFGEQSRYLHETPSDQLLRRLAWEGGRSVAPESGGCLAPSWAAA
jgi:hypothetical protein